MPKTDYSKAEKPRPRRTPPHVSLKQLRTVSGLKLDDVCASVSEILELPENRPFTRGALSAIEVGIRGASQQTLDAIAIAYGLEPGDIVTDFEPRSREPIPA